MDADDPDPLAKLDASARRAPKKARIAVGAAIVCFLLAVAVAAVLSAGGGGETGELITRGAEGTAEGGEAATAGADVAATDPGAVLLVHVLGAVARPGLVELTAGARVVDAIAAAGGLLGDADPAGVNLARAVADGEQLRVPKIGEVAAGSGDAGGAAGASGATGGGASGDGIVHLNAATLADLDTLPRIGPALAQRILDWRDANGPFTSVDQLREVAGIGDATFAGLVDLVGL